ncbi:MAG: PIN domain-containing protein [bacterium]|nr:PIN domain-containing protein [bacterium]
MIDIIVDSSVWVAFFNENDYFHEEAYSLIKQLLIEENKIIIPEIVFVETLNTFDLEQFHKKRREIENYWVKSEKVTLYNGGDFFYFTYLPMMKNPNQLKASDFTIFAYSKYLRAGLVTFDDKLKKAFETDQNE